MWCIKSPKGKLVAETLSDTKVDAEWSLFGHMDEKFRTLYWKKPDGNGGSRAAQRRLGYQAVQVELVEIKK